MVSPIVHQSDTGVQTARPEVIYRASITGRICRAFVIKEYDETLKVQGQDYNGDPRIIRYDDVQEWLPAPTPPVNNAPESQKNATSCDFAPKASSCPFSLQAVYSRRAIERYEALAAECYCEWQVERNYRGSVPLVWDDAEQLKQIGDAQRRYRQAQAHVDRLTGAPSPTVQLGDIEAVFSAWAIGALIELGTAEYTVASLMSDSLHEAISRAMDAGQLNYCMDVIGEIKTAPGRGVQLAYGNRRYEWAVQS